MDENQPKNDQAPANSEKPARPMISQSIGSRLQSVYPQPVAGNKASWGGVPISAKEEEEEKAASVGDLYGFAFVFGVLGVVFLGITLLGVQNIVVYEWGSLDAAGMFGAIVAPIVAVAGIATAFSLIYKAKRTRALAGLSFFVYGLYAVIYPLLQQIKKSDSIAQMGAELGEFFKTSSKASLVMTIGVIVINLVIIALFSTAFRKSEKIKKAFGR